VRPSDASPASAISSQCVTVSRLLEVLCGLFIPCVCSFISQSILPVFVLPLCTFSPIPCFIFSFRVVLSGVICILILHLFIHFPSAFLPSFLGYVSFYLTRLFCFPLIFFHSLIILFSSLFLSFSLSFYRSFVISFVSSVSCTCGFINSASLVASYDRNKTDCHL
jgi:hypothetical protein